MKPDILLSISRMDALMRYAQQYLVETVPWYDRHYVKGRIG